MSDALTTFFAAWSQSDASKRAGLIADAMTKDATYSDPRSGERLAGHGAISDYVGKFSANAPGWTATVDSSDNVNGYSRTIVAFGGKGPDGSEMVQHGTYFSEHNDAGQIKMMAGFVGTGAVE